MTELLGTKPWPASKVIGGIYEIRGVIGRGGFGLVYQAHDHATHRDIAVKVPLGREEFDGSGQRRLVRFVESPSAKASLVEEVRAWIGLAHPHVVRAFDVRDDESTDYLPAILMDLCDGGSLHGKIYGPGREPLPLAEGLDVAIQVCWGMEYVHQQGLVHRDLKPGNVLLARDKNGRLDKALVSDLGLAKALGAHGVTPDTVRDGDEAALWATVSQAGGTPSHMPPEQWEAGAHVGVASDVYAFGVMLYEMFCGRLPFECGTSLKAWQRAHREESVPEPGQFTGGIPTDLAALMKACVAKEPGARPQGFGDLGEKLARLYRQEAGRGNESVRPKPTASELTAEAKRAHAWVKVRLGIGADRRGDMEMAQREYSEAEATFRALEYPEGVSACVGNQALILKAWGRLEEAMSLLKEEESIKRSLRRREGLDACLGNQALILRDWGRLEEAMSLHKEEEAICRELRDQVGLARSLGNQGVILGNWGRLEEALVLHEQDCSICRELGDREGLSSSLRNQAGILQSRGLSGKAMVLLKEAEAICRTVGDRTGLYRSLGDQALILHAWGRLEEAMELHNEEESICRTLADRAGLAVSLGNQAVILQAWGRLKEAMGLQKENGSIKRALGDRAGLGASLGNQALILQAWGQLEEAMDLHKEEEAICRALGDKKGLSSCLGNQARILHSKGQMKEAMSLVKKQESINRELEDWAGLTRCLCSQGVILHALGQLEDAMGLFKEAESLGRELDNPATLGACLSSQALILHAWGRLEEAMSLHKEAEANCRALGDVNGLAISLTNQASILGLNLDRRNEAVAKAEEALRLCSQYGLTALAPQVQRILDAVRSQGR